MSQTPPPPYGYPAQPPPPGYPPPPGVGYGQLPPQYKTSGAAVTSFVLGLLGCLQVTGLLAILFGIVGIAKTGKPMVRGRGFAIAGLILGLLWLAGGGLVVAGVVAAVAKTAPDRATAKQLVADLAAGRVDHAATLCQPTVGADKLQGDSDKLKAFGTLADTTFFGFSMKMATQSAGGGTAPTNQTIVTGAAQFTNGQTHSVTAVLTPAPDGSGKHLVKELTIQ